MKVYRQIVLLALASILLVPTLASADWIESINGDLSGDRLAPSSLSLTPGLNLIMGDTVVGDRDYLTFNVPTGYSLIAFNLLNFISNDNVAFIGIQSGTTLTEPAVGTDPANLLGYAHFGAPVPTDYLPILGSAPGAIGFSGPLSAGDYTIWIQQTSPAFTEYSFQADVQAVPEASSGVLLLLGLTAFVAVRRP
jgi:hypothetical protein